MSKTKDRKKYYDDKYKELNPAKLLIEVDEKNGCIKVGDFNSRKEPHFSLKPKEIDAIIDQNNKQEIEKFNKIDFKSSSHYKSAKMKVFFPDRLQKVYSAKCFELFINIPSDKENSDHMTIAQAVKKYGWAGGRSGSRVVSKSRLKLIKRNIGMINRLVADGQANLVKMCIIMNEDLPAKKSEYFSKSSWKKCLKNTEHRNSVAAMMYLKAKQGGADLTFDDIFNLRSKTLSNSEKMCGYLISKQGLKVIDETCKQKSTGFNINRILSTIHDTRRMCRNQGVRYNDKWSYQRVLREHEELTRRANFSNGLNFPDDEKFKVSEIAVKKLSKKKKKFEKTEGGNLLFNKGKDNEVLIKVLSTKIDFREEASTMKHCIGSYCSRSRKGSYLALNISYTNPNISDPCTAGYVVDLNGNFLLQQVYGPRNSQPDSYLSKGLLNHVTKALNKKKKK